LLLGAFASITVGFSSAGLGLAGIFGGLADAEYALSLRCGLRYSCISIGIWGGTFLSALWWNDQLSQRFGLRSLLAILTAAAVLAAAISALLRL
jgi:hypothetical protein